jgi:hypothetical protein
MGPGSFDDLALMVAELDSARDLHVQFANREFYGSQASCLIEACAQLEREVWHNSVGRMG